MRQVLRAISIGLIVLFVAACGKSNSSKSSSPSPVPSSSGAPAASSSSASPAPSTGGVGNTSTNTPVERVVRQFQPSVVRISVTAPAASGPGGFFGGFGGSQVQQAGTGTGTVLDTNGHILTNNHVVTLDNSTTASSVSVTLPNGKTVQANVVGTDPQTDLAVIQVGASDRAGLQPIQWENPQNIVIGEEVVAIGYALDLGGAPTVTTGVVSAIDRSIPETDATISGAIQTDASINPGNSGGPLIDLNGKVVGINTAGLVGTPNQPAQGINFAISSQTAQPVAAALISQGHVTRGYMGVAVTDVTPDLAQANNLGVDHGAGIGEVTQGSPAAQAGLQPGDVITQVGDVPINNTGDLTNALTKYGPGQKVPVTFYRGNKQQTTSITLGTRPSSPSNG
jgi:S1-C subfamily serine protease